LFQTLTDQLQQSTSAKTVRLPVGSQSVDS
jgi:hypothetical protein